MRPWAVPALGLGALLAAGPVAAHDAFGDLGPFYASLLHPLADPAQGLLIAAVAVLLARQPLATVRPAYAALALAGAAAVLLAALVTFDPPGLRTTGFVAAALGAAALFGASIRPLQATLVATAIAVAAGLAVDLPPEPRAAGNRRSRRRAWHRARRAPGLGPRRRGPPPLRPGRGRRRRLLGRRRRHHGRRAPDRVTEPFPHASSRNGKPVSSPLPAAFHPKFFPAVPAVWPSRTDQLETSP